ncbi:MAG: MarR family transcriptional regulator [Clostridia bacterium]|nr:MarR family transcriptional regulator [Clostridia bacterium]MBQ7913701.1 MarR family transcriptional regulator [Clostridia bacterium]
METKKSVKKLSADEKHLQMLYELSKRREVLTIGTKNNHFKDTELRLLAEIVQANNKGERLISTQLADRLGITRSAISQIVNRLEENGIVNRVPDAVDRKIAYIELTDETFALYKKDWAYCQKFFGKLIKKFGRDRFYEMCALTNEFIDLVQEEKTALSKK